MMYAGIVSGNNAGDVWVDSLTNPAFCAVWSNHLGGFHFMGSSYSHVSKSKLLTFVENTVIPFLADKKANYCEFSCDSQEWIPYIMDTLSKYKINRGKQYVYKLPNKNNVNREIPRPVNYNVFEINSDFVSKELLNLENSEALYTDIEQTWERVEKFIKHGKGFVAIQNNKVCSFAITRFRYKDTYCIGVETFDPHKQKGLSGYLSMLLIKNIVNQGADIWWDCMADNIASQKTAMKIGLTFDHEYEIFWFDIL